MNIWPVMSVNTDPTSVTVGTGRYQTVPFNVSIPSNNSQLTTIQVKFHETKYVKKFIPVIFRFRQLFSMVHQHYT